MVLLSLLINPYIRHKRISDKALLFLEDFKDLEVESADRKPTDSKEELLRKVELHSSKKIQYSSEMADQNFFSSILLTESVLMVEA